MQRTLARVVIAAATSIAVLPWGATAVMAKMPYVSVEIAPTEPRPDEPITITVQTWSDVDHTTPADWGAEALVEDLLVIRAEGRSAPDIRLDLAMVSAAQFEATVSLPAGEWQLVAFPDRSGWADAAVPEGYPDTLAISVQPAGPNLQAMLGSIAGTFAALIATVASLAAGFATRP